MSLTRNLMWNAYSGLLTAATMFVAHKVLDTTWQTVTGDEAPDPNDPATPARDAVLWAIASGLGIGVSQLLVNRFAARRWEKFTGETPSPRRVNVTM
ncbi:DUF4235 domain-containing protein [Nigerium massiliense]|uniref:DUF4235 domain-containing protein n=1 Tax=Nigerium massiliense TaxID=1522317 RepID=UPI00058AF8FE|nr:DUF4235 domain-containing protein [Nigerium massiliense]